MWIFDRLYKSITYALSSGYLPKQFFASVNRNAQIRQLIPCPKDDAVVFYDEDNEEDGRECRKAICLALVEDWHGATHIEPVVRKRGIFKPPEDRGVGAWLTVDVDEQLVTASQYVGDQGEDGENNWAYAYRGEADGERVRARRVHFVPYTTANLRASTTPTSNVLSSEAATYGKGGANIAGWKAARRKAATMIEECAALSVRAKVAKLRKCIKGADVRIKFQC